MAVSGTSQAELFGHPRGLTVLATSEMWERFSFYGMQALLMLYMTKYLLQPDHARDVLGLAAYRSGLSHIVGPMTDLAFAAQTYGIYSGLLYGTPMIGAWLGDRVLGKTRTVTIGCLLMSAGHLAMASEKLFIAALLMIVVGAGGVVGNMFAQVGQLYEQADQRRIRAFGVYLITLNMGALAAPLVIGTLGEKVGWHYGFGAAGVGMLIGLATYLQGRRHLPRDVISKSGETPKLTRPEWRKVGAIILLLVPYILYSMATNQAYGLMYVWADTAVNRKVLGFEMPVTWIGTMDGILTILGVLTANRIWTSLAKKRREPDDFTKLVIGYTGIGMAFLFAAGIATITVVPLLLWVGFFVILDLSFGWSETPTQSVVSREAPGSLNALMMASIKGSLMISYFASGWLGRFYEPLGAPRFWALTASQALLAAVLIVAFKGRLMKLLGPEKEQPVA